MSDDVPARPPCPLSCTTVYPSGRDLRLWSSAATTLVPGADHGRLITHARQRGVPRVTHTTAAGALVKVPASRYGAHTLSRETTPADAASTRTLTR